MSLEYIVGTCNILAALMILSHLWNSTGTALGGWYEAKKLLRVSLGSKRPEVSLLERKEPYRVTFDAS
jgi:hypothetical protein